MTGEARRKANAESQRGTYWRKKLGYDFSVPTSKGPLIDALLARGVSAAELRDPLRLELAAAQLLDETIASAIKSSTSWNEVHGVEPDEFRCDSSRIKTAE